nr:hypothetical protein Iba_chr12cCG2920 [Ipomoea batatas]GMD71735.1 hypothetical protein Iba_chr12fCG1730 [Ipomoea batatas]
MDMAVSSSAQQRLLIRLSPLCRGEMFASCSGQIWSIMSRDGAYHENGGSWGLWISSIL